MTDQEMLDIYRQMKLRYGDRLPDPEHSPMQFAYYVKLFLYYAYKK